MQRRLDINLQTTYNSDARTRTSLQAGPQDPSIALMLNHIKLRTTQFNLFTTQNYYFSTTHSNCLFIIQLNISTYLQHNLIHLQRILIQIIIQHNISIYLQRNLIHLQRKTTIFIQRILIQFIIQRNM